MVDVADGQACDARGVGGLLAQTVEHYGHGEGRHNGVLDFFIGFVAGYGLCDIAIELGFLLQALIAFYPP